MKDESKVSAEEFIRAWQTSKSVGEVTKKTGLACGAVANRAFYYRRRGVDLKHMQGGAPTFDWKKLGALAKSLVK